MYMPANSWKSSKKASYVQLLFNTNSRQREAVSHIVQNFNNKIAKDESFLKAFPHGRNKTEFSNRILASSHNSDFNMHLSLTHSLYFKTQKAQAYDRFFLELEKVAKFDRYQETEKNPYFLALKRFKEEPMRVSFKPKVALLADSRQQKIFLTLLTSDETNERASLLIDYIDSLVTSKTENGISVSQYAKYDLDLMHSSIGHYTPRRKFKKQTCDFLNKTILSTEEYKVDEELLKELQFDVNFFIATKGVRSLKRIPFPR